MVTENQNEIITLLEELVKWTRFQGIQQAKGALERLLEGNLQRLIYHLSNGKSSEEISKAIGVSSQTVRNYWRSWYTSGIVSSSTKYKGRFEKVFNLEDLGIPLPKQGTGTPKEENGKAEEEEGDHGK
jgi:response regulator of citrate/malate metabolism